MNNKTKFLAIALSIFSLSARAEEISLVGGTVINPADGKVLPNATVVIDGDKIERVAIGKQDAASLGKQIDCSGSSFCRAISTLTFISFNPAICSRDRTAPI